MFKQEHRDLEDEYFEDDFTIADKVIHFAEQWNDVCPAGKEILVSRGDVKKTPNGSQYLVEPLIRYFQKFTSNSGWINPDCGWKTEALEAFSHFTYHRSGGSMIVCDLQGRYRHDRFKSARCRFELTDPAICSRKRIYGPTDMAEKGIETFFANHQCNQFCNLDKKWQRPREPSNWFTPVSGTSMFSSSVTHKLQLGNRSVFTSGLACVLEEPDSDDSDYDSDY